MILFTFIISETERYSLPLLLNFYVGYGISKAQEGQEGLKMHGTFHLLVCADDVNVYWART
jgi:hypothetical protein